jgi:predicted nucleic acid-binding protein
VWDEVSAHEPQALLDPRLRRVKASEPRQAVLGAWHLDGGEAAALSYALEQPDPREVLVLCDERQAREVCAALALSVVGSVGLIVAAFHEGRADRATCIAALRDLPVRGRLHIRPELIEAAVAAVNSSSP